METETRPLTPFARKAAAWTAATLKSAVRYSSIRWLYMLLGFGVLIVSTVYWAVLGAHVQAGNADQLSDPYMFGTWATFHGAAFPGAHSFLLKWPIFLLVSVFGISASSLVVATVAVCLVTVLGLAFILYKIDRRPLVFGSVCMALALSLLLIPAQSYAGGLLPVNMAMLTTRNIEYLVYITALICLIKAPRLRSRRTIIGASLLTLLIASDKLFLSLSLGGALLSLVVYALVQRWDQVTIAVRWLAASIVAAVGSAVLLITISGLHITHLINDGGASPYSVVSGAKNILLGITYATLGFFTNFGANPAYDNRLVSRLPHSLLERSLSLSGLTRLLAAIGVVWGLVLACRVVATSLQKLPRRKNIKVDTATQLSLALVWSTVVAMAAFVATNHYYAVDERYLAIGFFALAITAVTGLRRLNWRQPERLVMVGLVLVLGCICAAVTARTTAHQQQAALASVHGRNRSIAQALAHHKVDVLVGDYWRVLPIKLESGGALNTLPLGSCTQPRDALTSSVWQPSLVSHSFAYLITFDGSLTDFPHCDLAKVTSEYGRPNATQVIAGTLAKPKEVLLFYDHGRHQNPPLPKQVTAAAILPITPDQLIGTNCNVPTIMNVVAHEDDDILFTSPDLLHDVQAGRCIRTVYLTAGDGGLDKFYWLNRQLGAEAAYDSMLGYKGSWVQHTVQLASNEYVTIASPQENTKISLIFFGLPDGGLHGDGYSGSHNQSLEKLLKGSVKTLNTVDQQSSYTSEQLVSALSNLMNTYQPAEIRTQGNVANTPYPDHSDHITTGVFAQNATHEYDQQQFGGAISIPIKKYIGYPIHGYAQNVWGDDLAQKQAAFVAYGKFDGSVCHSIAQCSQTPTYGAYLTRQYTQDLGGQ